MASLTIFVFMSVGLPFHKIDSFCVSCGNNSTQCSACSFGNMIMQSSVKVKTLSPCGLKPMITSYPLLPPSKSVVVNLYLFFSIDLFQRHSSHSISIALEIPSKVLGQLALCFPSTQDLLATLLQSCLSYNSSTTLKS